jgi:hypothetical protein
MRYACIHVYPVGSIELGRRNVSHYLQSENKKGFSNRCLGILTWKSHSSILPVQRIFFPPEYGPLAAVTPGTPEGLC